MTRASHQRIARGAAAHGEQAYVPPPAGMLSEQVDLDGYGLALGLIHPEGSPLMVAVWNGRSLKRMLPEEATAFADELVKSGQAVPLAPVIEAVRKLVNRVGEIAAAAIMRQMEVAGRA